MGGTYDRADETQPIGNPPRLGNLLRVPLTSSPIERPSLLNHPVERADRLLNRRLAIRAMRINDVDIVQAESLQTALGSFNDVFSAEPGVVDVVVAKGGAPVDLGRHDDVVALEAEFLDGFAEEDFGLAAAVDFGGVEEVDAGVVGDFEGLEGGF